MSPKTGFKEKDKDGGIRSASLRTEPETHVDAEMKIELLRIHKTGR